MALTIGADTIISTMTCAMARRCDGRCGSGRPGRWHLSGHPDRPLPRAIAAMLLAELEAAGEPECYEASLYCSILGLL
ncbi:MAG TPA: hypothetical protein VLW44_22625 [Streptosporangiaceae bacterium]|nr:hypothetical protein [Streptosporangiaceae bacterium]